METKNFWFVLVLTFFPFACLAWDQTDLEIFDLYEEVNGTFYELLGVQQDAKVNEIRRAYRKLSLQLHPDKNKAENAEEQFRQLVAIYEVLKDTEKREKYNEVLKNGLPDWRQPLYYYRKYRKMGTLEISIIVSLIATVGHFLTWWVAYLEKKFEMEEVLAPLRKRREKKRAKKKLNDFDEEDDDMKTEKLLEKELGYRKPTFWDLLPFVLYRLFKNSILSIPQRIKDRREKREMERQRKLQEEEEEKELQALLAEKEAKPKKVKKPKKLRDASEFENEEEFQLACGENSNDGIEISVKLKDHEWTEEDYAMLAKAMAKFPGGTPGRWDRIAHELGRRADEVTKKVKEMKISLASASNNAAASGPDEVVAKKKQAIQLSDTIITKAIDNELNKTTMITDSDLYQSQYDIPDDYDEGCSNTTQSDAEEYVIVPKKVKVKTRPVEDKPSEDNEDNDSKDEKENKEIDHWSQVQQKCLEAAISQFPKSTSDRWTCIARAVPEKTKEQCIARYKLLVEHVKQKKQLK